MSVVDQYPEWMARKEGRILLTEADWPTVIGFKWGTFATGAGTIARDGDHGVGGTGAIRLTTGALVDDLTELKHSSPYYVGNNKIAFEMKWNLDVPAFGASTYSFGVELHVAAIGLLRAKFQYTVSSDDWKFESELDTFSAFSPTVDIAEPTSDTAAGGAGDQYAWARCIVDIEKGEFISFEAASKGESDYRDMTGIAIPNVTSTTENIMIFFGLGHTAGPGVEEYLTTDWAITAFN